MNAILKSAADEINTEWCYFLDMDGEDSDVFIHFFKRDDWFTDTKKVKPSPDDIMKYRIIIPIDPLLFPLNRDWDNLFLDGCIVSESNQEMISNILNDWGFINISQVKEITEVEERVLCM